jgi:hypothetical protein
MTETVLFDDMPMTFGDLPSALASKEFAARVYMEFTVVDPVDGTLRFLIGDSGFNSGVDRVYAAISSWGALRKFMAVDGRSRESETEIELLSDAIVTQTNGTKTYTVHQIVRDMPLFNVQVDFVQWSEADVGQQVIWSGYVRGIGQMKTEGGISTISLTIASAQASAARMISDIVSVSPAPTDSFGKMVPRAYGNFRQGLSSTDVQGPNGAIFLGYGSRMIEGVVVDENQASLKRKVRFMKNDGVTGAKEFTSGTTGNPKTKSDVWVWIPTSNTFAQVDASSYTVTNDSSEVSILVDAEPIVYVALRPSGIGTRMHSGFLGTAYKILDDDPTNYLETTGTDYQISFNVQPAIFPGLVVQSVACLLHFKNVSGGNRDFEFGIFNDFGSGPSGWWGNSNKRVQFSGVTTGTEATPFGPSPSYLANDANYNTGTQTKAEFSSGSFIGRDSSDNETPLQFYFATTSGSKDGVRVFDLGIVVKGTISLDKVKRLSASSRPKRLYDPQGRPRGWGTEKVTTITESKVAGNVQYKFLCNGRCQNDPSGTYDTAGEEIRNAVGIAHHILGSVGSMPVNVSTGTLGNFSDAKIEDGAGDKNFDPVFGPSDQITIDDAKALLQSRYPIRLHQENGTWQCLMDDLNPHPSRIYRSSSDIVRISARKHLVKGSLAATHMPFEQIVNLVTLTYGHLFGTNRPARSYQYSNYLSQRLFGIRPEKFVDEPWITADDISNDSVAAKYLARHAGRVFARPRLTVNCKLSEEFFDLRIGHIVEFDTDMELVGIQCPAYRCGKLDYAYPRSGGSGGPDQSDDATPDLLRATTSETYFYMSQQTDRLLFGIPGGGSYTTVANGWEYSTGTGTWAALSNVRRSDGGDPLAVFKASAGTYYVIWDRPTPTSWKKVEFVAGDLADSGGPSYGIRMKYNTAAALSGTALTTYPATWFGRLFEVLEVTRKPGSLGDYPYQDVVLQELM